MADRSNHYEAAFEAFIRARRVPCVAIDEAKRALCGEDGVKSPDFLLYPRMGPNLVVEVKGKRGKNAQGRRPWENWVTTLGGIDSQCRSHDDTTTTLAHASYAAIPCLAIDSN